MARPKKIDTVLETEVRDIDPETGDVNSGTDITESVTIDRVERDDRTADSKPQMSAAELREVYERLNEEVGYSVKRAHELERELLADVKKQLSDYAGNVEELRAKKLEAFKAWEAAEQRETDASQRQETQAVT